ncbi:RnfABCDGE type electron transport complex subunit D [candidate division WOR-3 bacterium]|nr:RnfABCDGE type electron transport complex subunit D [candidate division WOR-3 bacterium]
MLRVSSYPHIRDRLTTQKIMFIVIGSLMPAFAGAIFFFGMKALLLTTIAILSSVVCEIICQAIRKRPITVGDGSAILTGLLLGLTLPPDVPYFLPVIGASFAIVVGKQLFGGLGYNIFNPALVGRAFLVASWPLFMTDRWVAPRIGTMSGINPGLSSLDLVTEATPLNTAKLYLDIEGVPALLNASSTLSALFFGQTGGSIGETSVILLLLGAIVLLLLRIIDYRIPLSYFLTVFSLTGILWILGIILLTPIFHILSGGLFLGAFFMATDYVTSPITKKGRWIFGIGCGIITIVIRVWGGYPEGVAFSILLMNAATPVIDRFTRPRIFGH